MYEKNHSLNLDYKALYYDKEIKEDLLKLLDIEEYIKFLLEEYRESKKNTMDIDSTNSLAWIYIRNFTKEQGINNFDSIYNDKELYQHYKEKTIDWFVNQEQVRLEEEKEKLLPPSAVLSFHSLIRYPEAYKKIKKWWVNNEIPFIDRFGTISSYSYYLLNMNDPELINQYNLLSEKFIRTKKDDESIQFLNFIKPFEFSINTSFAIEKLIELAFINIEFKYMSGINEPLIPSDYCILEILYYECKDYKISDFSNIPKDYEYNSLNLKEKINIMRKNKADIINASQILVKKKKEEEQYWMVNMPFNK
jgi:hypothetical protein